MLSETELAAFRVVDAGSLMWSVELEPAEALQVAWALQPFNTAWPERIAAMMGAVNAAIPAKDVGAGLAQHHIWRVGREYSRAVYVRLYDFYLPEGFDWAALELTLRAAGREAWADESGWAAHDWAHWHAWRWWWD